MIPVTRILCPTDFSEPASTAMKRAGELAAHFGADLYVMHVLPLIEPPPYTDAYFMALSQHETKAEHETEQELQQVVAQVPPGVKVHTVIGHGDVAMQIVQAAREKRVDLLVTATHGLTGWRHLVFGSAAERIVLTAPCPVLVISRSAAEHSEKTMLPLRQILCPTDYSVASYDALRTAVELAKHFGAELSVQHVVPTISEALRSGQYAAPEYNQMLFDGAREKLCTLIAERVPDGVSVRPLVQLGDAGTEIIRLARQSEPDLIVIATHGLTGWRHLIFGSVTESVLHDAPVPVLVIHPATK